MAALATPAQLASYMQKDVDTSTAILLLDQASALVRAYCGWHITPSQTETFTLDGSGRTVLSLPSLHVTAVTSVTEDGVLLVDGTDYTWSGVGYLTRGANWVSTADFYWRRGWTNLPRGVVVVLTHGYPDAAEVVGVVLGIAARAFTSPTGVTRWQVGGESESYSATGPGTAGGMSLVTAEMAVLDRYRIPGAP